MWYIVLIAALWGGTVAPLVLLALLLMERRRSAKRQRMLRSNATYVERMLAIREIEDFRPPIRRRFELGDPSIAPAAFALWIPAALVLVSPILSGATEVALLLSATCGVWWWRRLETSGVTRAWHYPLAAWTFIGAAGLAVTVGSIVWNFPARDSPEVVDPFLPLIWDNVFSGHTFMMVAAAWGLIASAVTVIVAMRTHDSRLPALLVLTVWAPFAAVVWAGSFSGAHQIAFAAGLIGYALSRSNRRVRDSIEQRAMISAGPDSDWQRRPSTGEFDRNVLVPNAALCIAVVAVFFAARWGSANLGIEGRWPELTALALGAGIAIAYWKTRVSLMRAATYGLLVATAATLLTSTLVIGSWTVTAAASPDPFSFLNPWPTFIYIQAMVAAFIGAFIVLWAAVKRNLGGYGAMSMGFMWPLTLAYLLNVHGDREMEWFWQLHDWILVPVFAIAMVAAMRVVTHNSRPRGAHCDDVTGM